MGPIVVPTGTSTTLPPFNVHVMAGTTVTITELYAYALSGSLTLTVQQNGVDVPGLVGITVTTTPTVFTPTNPIVVADLDQFSITPVTITSAPEGLACNFFKTVAA